MGLAGYNDRDRNNNETMCENLSSSLGISYIKKEKIKDVTPKQLLERREDNILRTYNPESFIPPEYILVFQEDLMQLINKCRKIPDAAFCFRPYMDSQFDEAREQYKKILQSLESIFKVDIIYFPEDFFRFAQSCDKRRNVSKKKLCKIFEDLLLYKVDIAKKITDEDKIFKKTYEDRQAYILKLKDKLEEIENTFNIYEKVKVEYGEKPELMCLKNEQIEKKKYFKEELIENQNYISNNAQSYSELISLIESERI